MNSTYRVYFDTTDKVRYTNVIKQSDVTQLKIDGFNKIISKIYPQKTVDSLNDYIEITKATDDVKLNAYILTTEYISVITSFEYKVRIHKNCMGITHISNDNDSRNNIPVYFVDIAGSTNTKSTYVVSKEIFNSPEILLEFIYNKILTYERKFN
jgi:hypothetical protein